MNKNVYIGLSLDIIHNGHIRLILEARKLGKLTVGLLTDKAIATQKKLPLLSFAQRKEILENIQGVSKIVAQNEWDYSKNILKLKPDIVVHGDDWNYEKSGKKLKANTLKALKKVGGKLVEIPHTKNISSYSLQKILFDQNMYGVQRSNYLRRLIEVKDIVRILETHSPLSAIIAETAYYSHKDGRINKFDGFWSSSLTDATLKGKPDIEVLELKERLQNINDIFDVTTKPLIIDIDTGGKIEHLEINIKTIERSGVSAVIMEDKKGLKKNSLLGTEVKQEQETIKKFSQKIFVARKSTKNKLMIIARIESLILGKTIQDALSRAAAYIKAGADGIMIHSKSTSTKEIFSFAKKFRKKFQKIPLVAVPSTYSHVTEKQLINRGFNIVIYANHMLRASYPAMHKVASEILKNGRSLESEKTLLSINKILKLIPGTK